MTPSFDHISRGSLKGSGDFGSGQVCQVFPQVVSRAFMKASPSSGFMLGAIRPSANSS
jgi:hypothetical protein